MRHLVLKLIEPADGIKFFPGQYLDLMVPGTEESRSFSMANTPGRDGRFEFVIKVYPDGLFSEYLADEAGRSVTAWTWRGPSAPSRCGKAAPRRSSSSAAVRGWPRFSACSDRWRSAA